MRSAVNRIQRASGAAMLSLLSVGADAAPAEPGWTFELGAAYSRAAGSAVDVELGPRVALSGQTQTGNGLAGRLAVGRQFEPRNRSGETGTPWRLELELWQHEADRSSVQVGQLKLAPGDRISTAGAFLNALVPVVRSDAESTRGQPNWRLWVGGGIGWAQTKQPGLSSAACNCLPSRADGGAATQLKLQLDRRLGDESFVVTHLNAVRTGGAATAAGSYPVTRYAGRALVEAGVSLRWTFR